MLCTLKLQTASVKRCTGTTAPTACAIPAVPWHLETDEVRYGRRSSRSWLVYIGQTKWVRSHKGRSAAGNRAGRLTSALSAAPGPLQTGKQPPGRYRGRARLHWNAPAPPRPRAPERRGRRGTWGGSSSSGASGWPQPSWDWPVRRKWRQRVPAGGGRGAGGADFPAWRMRRGRARGAGGGSRAWPLVEGGSGARGAVRAAGAWGDGRAAGRPPPAPAAPGYPSSCSALQVAALAWGHSIAGLWSRNGVRSSQLRPCLASSSVLLCSETPGRPSSAENSPQLCVRSSAEVLAEITRTDWLPQVLLSTSPPHPWFN